LYWFNIHKLKTVLVWRYLNSVVNLVAKNDKTRRGFPRRVLFVQFGLLAVDP
jgi:hypothetical protein